MIKEIFTKNLSLKSLAIVLAIILWAIARYWVQR